MAMNVNAGANAYFRNLCALMGQMQATSRQGDLLPMDEAAARAVDMILTVRESKRKVLLVGNGGSAAIVAHMHNDLIKAVGTRALVFTETALLTAYTNDDGYDAAFEQQVNNWADPGDLIVAVSSSGQSENILRATKQAQEHGCMAVTVSGFRPDNPLRAMGDLNFHAPSEHYGFVELAHSVLLHHLTDAAASSQIDANDESNTYEIVIQATHPGHGSSGLRRRRVSA